jgi:hypothetical protein
VTHIVVKVYIYVFNQRLINPAKAVCIPKFVICWKQSPVSVVKAYITHLVLKLKQFTNYVVKDCKTWIEVLWFANQAY